MRSELGRGFEWQWIIMYEPGSYCTPIDCCITHLQAQGPPRICIERYKEEGEGESDAGFYAPPAFPESRCFLHAAPLHHRALCCLLRQSARSMLLLLLPVSTRCRRIRRRDSTNQQWFWRAFTSVTRLFCVIRRSLASVHRRARCCCCCRCCCC